MRSYLFLLEVSGNCYTLDLFYLYFFLSLHIRLSSSSTNLALCFSSFLKSFQKNKQTKRNKNFSFWFGRGLSINPRRNNSSKKFVTTFHFGISDNISKQLVYWSHQHWSNRTCSFYMNLRVNFSTTVNHFFSLFVEFILFCTYELHSNPLANVTAA